MSAPAHELGARRTRSRHLAGDRVAAILLQGDDAESWLEEIARWGIETSRLELAVLPRGVIVILPRRGVPAERLRGIPYRRIGATLLMPMDAELDAAVTPEELVGLLAAHTLVVFHPAFGMVAFSGDELLPVDRLLKPPPLLSSARWDAAVAGPATRPRLTSVRLEPAPPAATKLESVFAAERQQIASASAAERAAEETSTSPPSLRQRMREVVDRLRQRDASNRGGRGDATRSHDPALERRRRSEIERLLHLLAEDPDRGLRFALPVASAFGEVLPDAPPSPTLPEREPVFSLGWREGARAVDSWRATKAQHAALVAHYLRLAAREVAFGRHRRAAYIQAELLGDLELAASTLRDGECWRDAATLYLAHLGRPLMAARCLQDGGYLEEAAELYFREGEAELAGELHERLGDVERAHSAFRSAVQKRLEAGDRVSAARLLETRLGAVDEALATLSSGWPSSPQSRECLCEMMLTLGRHGRHHEARGLATRLALAPERAATAARALSSACASYPDRSTRAALGDAVRVIAGRVLTTHTQPASDEGGLSFAGLKPSQLAECESLLDAVRDLEHSDRLLARDVDRARVEIGRAAARSAQAPRKTRLPGKEQDRRLVSTARSLMLPRDADWLALETLGESLVAAGRTELGPVLVRCDSEGLIQRMDWRRPSLQPAQFLLAAHPGSDRISLVTRPREDLPVQTLPATDRFEGRVDVGTPIWLQAGVLGIAAGQGRTLWTMWRNTSDGLVIDCRSLEGRVLTTELLPGTAVDAALDPQPGERGAPMLFVAPALWFALGADLHVLGSRGELASCVLPEPARQIVLVSSSRRSTRLVTVGHRSLSLIERSRGGIAVVATVTEDELELEEPVAAVTAKGALMVFSRVGGYVWHIEGTELEPVSPLDPMHSPCAAVSLRAPDEIAVMQTTGELAVLAARRG